MSGDTASASSSEFPIANSDIMLVCIMPSPRDLDIARLLGWYRIPLRFAPKLIDVDYLAFYQAGRFGPEHRWQIEYFAELRGHELTRRRDLVRDEPDHPRADEEYYRLQIGALQHLKHPIKAGKWKRITFFYTLGRLFKSAQAIDELLALGQEREVIWQSLRERANACNSYRVDDEMELPLELFTFIAVENSLLRQQTSDLEQDY